MDQEKRIADKLRHIRQLWAEQERLDEGSPEEAAVLKKIRVLSDEYKALIETQRKSRT
jgi:hypothetical protein